MLLQAVSMLEVATELLFLSQCASEKSLLFLTVSSGFNTNLV